MAIRNQDELLKKQEKLEAYLLENPQSTLFAWYARQNMEAGELDRALNICKLGIQHVESKGALHKLLGEIFMAKGEVTQSMKHLVECILTREPFPGVIIEVVKNLGDTMEAEQIAFLVHLLNKALPGHPDATKFYHKYPSARNMTVQPGQYKFLEDLAASLERSAMVEVLPLDDLEETSPDFPAPAEFAADPEPLAEIPNPVIPEPVKEIPKIEIPETQTEPVAKPVTAEPLPEPAAPPPEQEKPVSRKAPAVKHNITRSMATFTLMQIFKDQGMYDNALEVLLFLREKSTNLERIENEEQEIRELMAKNTI